MRPHAAAGSQLEAGAAGEHRDEQHRHDQRGDERGDHRQAKVAEHLPGEPLDKDHREKHADRRQRRGNHRAPHFRRPSDGGGAGRVALLAAAVNRLEHHDRRVHQHADAHRQAAKRHDVERHVEEIQRRERHKDRDRNAQCDDRCRADVAQEKQQHDHGEQAAEQRRVEHLLDAVVDEDRAVGDHAQLGLFLVEQLAGERRAAKKVFHFLALQLFRAFCFVLLFFAEVGHLADECDDALGHGDHVGVGLFVNIDLHALRAVGVGEHLAVALPVHHLAKVFHSDLAALAAEHDRVGDFLESLVFVDGADHVFRAALADAATGGVDVFRAQPAEHLANREVHPLQLGLVDQHMNLLLEPAANSRRRDTFDRLDEPLDLQLGDAPQSPQACVAPILGAAGAGQAQLHHRVKRRVVVQEQRLLRLARQVNEVEFLECVLDGIDHRRAPGELQHHVAHAGAADAADLVEPADDAERLLDRAADVVLDLFRRGAGVLGADGEGRVTHLRHERDRQLAKREIAENDGS